MFKNIFNKTNYNYEYIPYACLIDENTILTKNGQILQTIIIHGIESKNLVNDIKNLRNDLRKTINAFVTDKNVSFWVHNIRDTSNLEDDLTYSNIFSNELHNLWFDENSWRKNYSNTIYITIVYLNYENELNDVLKFSNTLNFNSIAYFNHNYIDDSLAKLKLVSAKILAELNVYEARLLGLFIENDIYYSEQITFYSFLNNYEFKKKKLKEIDLSQTILLSKYKFNNDEIEFINDKGKKYAAILSIKEYQELNLNEIDEIIQLPFNYNITEIFYNAQFEDVETKFKHYNTIIQASRDYDLDQWHRVQELYKAGKNVDYKFRQINIHVYANDTDELNENISIVSKNLFKAGINHVREDIGLEYAYYANFPGNFKFLKRLKPTVTDTVLSFGSIQNSSIGITKNNFSKYLTILNSEKNTPYFFNIYDLNNGHTLILGNDASGKTTLINFIISEFQKFKPEILYLSNDSSSTLFMKALGGVS